MRLTGTLGTLSALLDGGPLPLDVGADAGDGATASVRGVLADPRGTRGLDAAVSARVPNLAALFVILFVYGWNQYLWPLLVATDPSLDTVVIGIVKMIGTETQADWARVMAVAVLALLPPVLVVLLMQRWFVRGLAEADK